MNTEASHLFTSNPLARTPFLTCDGHGLQRLIQAGLVWLEQHYEAVNRLNVFPVPDGDTGTNMLLTLRAAHEAAGINSVNAVGVVAESTAQGALHGSRGNSGTVLSQFFRGFADALRGHETFDAPRLALSFRLAVQEGYRTFQKPVEGTILTVAREIAAEVERTAASTGDLRQLLRRGVQRGKHAVAETPMLLPILQKAGVVDSGGQGLVIILEGMLRLLHGQTLELSTDELPSDDDLISEAALNEAFALSEESGDEGFGFDVQYVIQGQNLAVESIRDSIRAMGRSAIVIGNPQLVKVHVHVHDPEVPLAFGRKQGQIADVVVEDMQQQSENYRALRTTRALSLMSVSAAPVDVVAVVPGDGLRMVFHDLGAAAVVSGGQSMNPSVGELAEAIRRVTAQQVVVLPNNSNVILTAEQAAALVNDSGAKQVAVVATRTLPQGIAALYMRESAADLVAVTAAMGDSIAEVISGAITTAIHDLKLDDLTIEAGQIIGLIDDDLVAAGASVGEVLRDLLRRMVDESHEVVTLYYGDQISEAEARALVTALQVENPDLTFDVLEGGQPHYLYILAVE